MRWVEIVVFGKNEIVVFDNDEVWSVIMTFS